MLSFAKVTCKCLTPSEKLYFVDEKCGFSQISRLLFGTGYTFTFSFVISLTMCDDVACDCVCCFTYDTELDLMRLLLTYGSVATRRIHRGQRSTLPTCWRFYLHVIMWPINHAWERFFCFHVFLWQRARVYKYIYIYMCVCVCVCVYVLWYTLN